MVAGNFGNNYSDSMKVRKEIIHLWPNNPKIIFPQTIFFSNDTQGKYDLLEAQELYTNSNRIILFYKGSFIIFLCTGTFFL